VSDTTIYEGVIGYGRLDLWIGDALVGSWSDSDKGADEMHRDLDQLKNRLALAQRGLREFLGDRAAERLRNVAEMNEGRL
jgi:hypothetical protein